MHNIHALLAYATSDDEANHTSAYQIEENQESKCQHSTLVQLVPQKLMNTIGAESAKGRGLTLENLTKLSRKGPNTDKPHNTESRGGALKDLGVQLDNAEDKVL
jgi:hypothetical protein